MGISFPEAALGLSRPIGPLSLPPRPLPRSPDERFSFFAGSQNNDTAVLVPSFFFCSPADSADYCFLFDESSVSSLGQQCVCGGRGGEREAERQRGREAERQRENVYVRVYVCLGVRV